MTMLTENEIQNRLQRADHRDFQKLVGALWQRRGWEVSVIEEDMHIRCTNSAKGQNSQIAIQCHRHQSGNPVTKTHIEGHSELAARSDLDRVIVVTTSRFTDGARRQAEIYGIELVSSSELAEIIQEVNGEDLLRELTPTTALGMLSRSLRSIFR